MEQIKNNIAKNIMEYRKQAGFTQQELAEKLNYSDKTVSKWERAEGVPDIFVLKDLADLFGVTVDDFLREHQQKKTRRNHIGVKRVIITALSVVLVWLIATIVMAVFLWIDPNINVATYTYISALPVSCIVALVFSCIWGKLWHKGLFVSALIWTICIFIDVCFPLTRSWLVYIIGAVLQLLVVLWFVLCAFIKKDKKGS